MKNVKKLTASAFLIALGVVLSTFSIPMGIAKCFPVQHLVNVIAGVTLGPGYGVSIAFVISCIRVMMGTGTLLAFPGSMVGALLCGIVYHMFKKTWAACLGEVFGTGILGALLAYPAAAFLMGKEVAVFTYVVPFLVSTSVGSLLAFIALSAMEKTGIVEKLKIKENKHENNNAK